jgi:hypothetical protein
MDPQDQEKQETPSERLERLRKLARLKELREKAAGGAPVPSMQSEGADPDYFGSGVIEPARAMGEGLLREIYGGWSGLFAAAGGGAEAGAEQVESVREGNFQPRTESGQRNMQALGDLAEFSLDAARFPVAVAQGVATAATEGPEAGNQAIEGVMERGVSQTLGNEVLERTGSPALAAAAHTLPEAMGLYGGRRAFLSDPVQEAGDAIVDTATSVLPPVRRRNELIQQGSTDARTVGYRGEEPRVTLSGSQTPELPAPDGTPEFTQQGARYNRISRDPVQREAVRQGFRPGIVTMIRESAPADRAGFEQMLGVMDDVIYNPANSIDVRPTDIVGDAVMDRYNYVRQVNQEAAQELNAAVEGLKRPVPENMVDVAPPVNRFLENLNEAGIGVNDDLSLNFDGSMLEGTNPRVTQAQTILNDVVKRMRDTNVPTAYDVHRLKKYIDEMVEFGKSEGGVLGQAENILKELRAGLNESIASRIEPYREANQKYSETISALNDFEKVAGPSIDLSAAGSGSAAGQIMRGLMSNNRSRVALRNNMQQLEDVAASYGGSFDNSISNLALFADELDAIFGPVARTSFGGQISQQVPTSSTGLLTRGVDYAYDKLRGVNEETRLEAMRELLRSFE